MVITICVTNGQMVSAAFIAIASSGTQNRLGRHAMMGCSSEKKYSHRFGSVNLSSSGRMTFK
jgi:hypothetical protein